MYKAKVEARKKYREWKAKLKLEASKKRNQARIERGRIKRALQMGEE